MGRRYRNHSPLSLFSFQDIITSTTGILILITLILCMSISQLPESYSEIPLDDGKEKAQLAQSLAAIEKLRDESERLEKQSQVLVGMTPEELRRQLSASEAARARIETILAQVENDRQATDENLKSKSQELAALAGAQQQLAQLQQRVVQLQAELEEVINSDRVVFNFRNSSGEVPWILEIAGDRIVVARAGRSELPRVFDSNSAMQRLRDFEKWLNDLPLTDRYFVALVRPDGTQIYAALGESNGVRPLLDRANAIVGVDLINRHQVVIDAQTGAAF